MDKNFIISNNPYEFDTDKNEFPCFTRKNIDFITAVINADSTYRVAFDKDDTSSSANLLHKQFPKNDDVLLEAVTRIDRENSTHLIVSGNEPKKDKYDTRNKQGINITVKEMLKLGLDNLGDKIEKGDKKIVVDIASYVPGRFNFSFASKFCAYCNRYCFGKDDYSIYDSVLAAILPYYAFIYLGEEYWKIVRGTERKESKIQKEFADKNGKMNYEGYNYLIGRIIDKVRTVPELDSNLTRKDFDLLLWYYFKGNDIRIKKANLKLGVASAKLII